MGGDRKEKVTARVPTGELARLSVSASTTSGTVTDAADDPASGLALGTDRPAQKAVEHRPTSKIAKEDLAGLLAQSDLARVVEDDALVAALAKSSSGAPVLAKGSSPEAALAKAQSLPAITPPAAEPPADVVTLEDDDRKTRKMDAGQFQDLIAHGVPMERRQRAETIDDPERLGDALREMGDDILAIPVEPSVVVGGEPAKAAEPAKPAPAKAEPSLRHSREMLAPITKPPPIAEATKEAATEEKRETAQVRRFETDTGGYRYPDAGSSDLGLAIAVVVIILGAVGGVALFVI